MDLFQSVGSQEILMILLVALIVIGPNKIAEVGKQLGTMSLNLKKATTDFSSNLQAELDLEEKAKQAAKTDGKAATNATGTGKKP